MPAAVRAMQAFSVGPAYNATQQLGAVARRHAHGTKTVSKAQTFRPLMPSVPVEPTRGELRLALVALFEQVSEASNCMDQFLFERSV